MRSEGWPRAQIAHIRSKIVPERLKSLLGPMVISGTTRGVLFDRF